MSARLSERQLVGFTTFVETKIGLQFPPSNRGQLEQRNAPILMTLASADSPLYEQKSIAAGAACFFDKDTDQNAPAEARKNAGESARPKDTTT